MKRRHFLKLAVTLPFVGAALAESKPEPKVETAEDFRLDQFSYDRPFLYILLGRPKSGKTLLAEKLWNARHGIAMDFETVGSKFVAALPQTIQIDCNGLQNPAGDCDSLRSMGINVVAVLNESKDTKTDLISYGYGGYSGRSNLFYRADAIFRVEGYTPPDMTREYPRHQWKLQTLKTRLPNPHGERWGFWSRV